MRKWLRFWFYVGIHPTEKMEGTSRLSEVKHTDEVKKARRVTRTMSLVSLILSVLILSFASCSNQPADGTTPIPTSTGTTVNGR